jgi:ubiquinone/menaquinone biosynthesis C-methylase UbiE
MLGDRLSAYDEAYFARIARWSGLENYAGQLEQLLRLMRLSPSDRVLDVGCGTGTAMRLIQKIIGTEIHGVDPSAAAWPHLEGLNRIRGNAESLPFENASFDAVLMLHVLGHVDDPARSLLEASRVLKPSGKLGIITPNSRFVRMLRPFNRLGLISHRVDPTIIRYYSSGALVRALEQAGLEVRYCVHIGDLPVVLGPLASLGRPRFLRQRVVAVAQKAGEKR